MFTGNSLGTAILPFLPRCSACSSINHWGVLGPIVAAQPQLGSLPQKPNVTSQPTHPRQSVSEWAFTIIMDPQVLFRFEVTHWLDRLQWRPGPFDLVKIHPSRVCLTRYEGHTCIIYLALPGNEFCVRNSWVGAYPWLLKSVDGKSVKSLDRS
jgi:hypothetical protein